MFAHGDGVDYISFFFFWEHFHLGTVTNELHNHYKNIRNP